MHVCVPTWVCVCVCLHMSACLCVHTRVLVCTNVHVSLHICTCVLHEEAIVSVCVCICVHVSSHVCVSVHRGRDCGVCMRILQVCAPEVCAGVCISLSCPRGDETSGSHHLLGHPKSSAFSPWNVIKRPRRDMTSPSLSLSKAGKRNLLPSKY